MFWFFFLLRAVRCLSTAAPFAPLVLPAESLLATCHASVLCLTQKHLTKQALIYDSSERCNLRFLAQDYGEGVSPLSNHAATQPAVIILHFLLTLKESTRH